MKVDKGSDDDKFKKIFKIKNNKPSHKNLSEKKSHVNSSSSATYSKQGI